MPTRGGRNARRRVGNRLPGERARAGEPSRAKRAPTRTSFVSGEGRSAGRCARKRESAATPLVALVRCHEAARDFSRIDHTRGSARSTVDGHALRKRLRGTPILARVPGTQRARQDDVTLSRRRHRRCGARAAEAAGARGRVGLRHQRVPVSAVGGRVQIRDAVRARGGGRGALRLHRARRGRRTSPPEAETNRADHLGGGEGARLLRRALSRPPPAASPATAVAPTRAVHVRGRIPTVPSPPARTPPRVPRGDSVDATPKSTCRTPRGSVAASPPSSSSSAAHRTPRGSHSANPSARAPPSATSKLFGTAPRFAYSRSTPDLEPSRRASPGELRRVAPSAPAAPNRSGGSVIRAPVRVRGCTPGQAYRIDRVARNRAYQEAWNRDAFLSSKENRGAIGRGPTATAAVVPRQSENVKAAVAAAREMNRRNVEAARGQSRTQTKLTSSFGRVGDGVGRGRGSAAFATPDSKRRDDVRWEIRRMMAEPPTF